MRKVPIKFLVALARVALVVSFCAPSVSSPNGV